MSASLAVVLALLAASPAQEADDAAIRKLVEQLGADFLDERDAARRALEKVGKNGEAHLIQGLASGDHRIRRNCIELLAAFKSVKAMDRAAELFRSDEDASVRDASFKLFQALGKEAEDHLIAALDSPAVEHRRGAIHSLMEFKSEKCAEKMAALHEREQDKDVKAAAFTCLQALGYQPFLLRCLKSPDANLRRDAFNGLVKAQGDNVLAAVGELFAAETDPTVIDRAYNYLKDAKEKAQPHYLAGLKNPTEQARQRSLEGLKALKDERAIAPVADILMNDGADKVRELAAEFLTSQGLKAEAPLVKALSSPNVKVRLLAIQSLGAIKSEKPLEEIAKLFREDKDAEVHKKSFEYLQKLGIRAEKDLLYALGDESKEIRKQAIQALGNAKSEAAIDRLIDFLIELDKDLKPAAADALARIGPKAVEAVQKASEEGRVKKRSPDPSVVTAETVLFLFYQEGVERLLDALVTDTGESGFFEGQFRDLVKFGKDKAMPVLIRIVREPNYQFRLIERRDALQDYPVRMHELAIMAIGELGDASAIEPLKAALRESGSSGLDGSGRELMVALYRLGDKGPVEEFLKKANADATTLLQGDAKEDGCSLLFSLGLVLNRVGRRDEAEAAYLRLVRAVEEQKLDRSREDTYPTALYNLACLSSLKGDKAKGVAWLRKAVVAGFKDRQWIKMDRDLDAVRNEREYLELLSDDKLFEAKPED